MQLFSMVKTLKKQRIGFHTDATGYGGAEQYLKLLMENIDKSCYDVYFFRKAAYPVHEVFGEELPFIDVVYEGESEHLEKSSDREEISSIKNDSYEHKKKFSIKSFILKLIPPSLKLYLGLKKDIERKRQIFAQYNLDILHTNDTSPTPDVAAISAYQAEVSKVIVTFHVLPKLGKSIKDIVYRWLIREVGKAATTVLVNAEYSKRSWVQYVGHKHKFKVTHLGIDLKLYDNTLNRDQLKNEIKIPCDKIIIGLTGRLTHMKGQLNVVESAVYLVKNFPNIHFLFMGEGEQRQEIEEKIRQLELSQYFTLAGHKSDAPLLTKVYDIALLPSTCYETFGFVNLEAMAYSIPVIASRFGGIPEVVSDQETGILVRPNSVEDLVESIERLLHNPNLRSSMGSAGRKRVEKYFQLKDMLNKTYQVYEN